MWKNFLVIVGHLYKMGAERTLQRYVPDFEQNNIFVEAHGGDLQGNYVGKETT